MVGSDQAVNTTEYLSDTYRKRECQSKNQREKDRDVVEKSIGQFCPCCQAPFSKLNPCTWRKQSSLLLNTAHTLLHSCRPVQSNPVQYCTYHCGPLSPLICCQTGRPGRKPWRGSCVNQIQEKREETEIPRVETVKADYSLPSKM